MPSFPVSPHLPWDPPSTGPLPGPCPPLSWTGLASCVSYVRTGCKEGCTVFKIRFFFLDLNYKCCKEMEDQCIEYIKILMKQIYILKIHKESNLIPNLLIDFIQLLTEVQIEDFHSIFVQFLNFDIEPLLTQILFTYSVMSRSSTSRAALQEHKLHWPRHIGACFVSISCVCHSV